MSLSEDETSTTGRCIRVLVFLVVLSSFILPDLLKFGMVSSTTTFNLRHKTIQMQIFPFCLTPGLFCKRKETKKHLFHLSLHSHSDNCAVLDIDFDCDVVPKLQHFGIEC
jgi:hypothetical protein